MAKEKNNELEKRNQACAETITKEDVQIAKNYLTEKELTYLNLLVSQYLDFAEKIKRGLERCVESCVPIVIEDLLGGLVVEGNRVEYKAQ